MIQMSNNLGIISPNFSDNEFELHEYYPDRDFAFRVWK